MNPKISIAVDAKNKAVATITGMATVGAKIDVDVTGIAASDVPEWGSDDDYTGYSLRFRIVDVMGKDLVRYQLVKKTETTPDVWTWDATNSKFTATGVDFDTDVLRKAFVGVPYNETLEFGIILDSYVDKAQYAVGKIKIRQWAVASTEDPTVLPDWRETLAELKEDLEAVEASKTAAAASATSAAGSATSASTSANSASTSANSALASATAASTAVQHYPQIGANGNWWVWNVTTSAWEDSGKSACGYASWFYDQDTQLYHKVLISKNSLNEYVTTVDQTGVATPSADVYVDLVSNQSVGGTKTFVVSPIVPTPTANMQAATKKYVDDAVAVGTSGNNLVHKSGTETITGAKLITSTGTTTARSLQDRFGEVANVMDFGAVGDGMTDDSSAFQRAINSLCTVVDGAVTASHGGVVYVPNKRFYLGSSITLYSNICLIGAKSSLGNYGYNASRLIEYNCLLWLNPNASIIVHDSAQVRNLCILNTNFRTLPTFTQETIGSYMTGNAIVLADYCADAMLSELFIGGFAYGITTDQSESFHRVERIMIDRVHGDCLNGIKIANSCDVTYISNCHFWTYFLNPSGWIYRTTGINLYGQNDWTKVTNCFTYGYKVGINICNANSVTLLGCSCDNIGEDNSTEQPVGISVSGNSLETRIHDCQCAAQYTGILLNSTNSNAYISIANCNVWSTASKLMRFGINVANGRADISNCVVRNSPASGDTYVSESYGLTTGFANSANVIMDGGIVSGFEYAFFANANTRIDYDNVYLNNFNYVKGGNGNVVKDSIEGTPSECIKFSNGVMLEYGYIDVTGDIPSSSNKTITFSTPFSSVKSASVTYEGDNCTTADVKIITSGLYPTGMTVKVSNLGSTSATAFTGKIRYIAVGLYQ